MAQFDSDQAEIDSMPLSAPVSSNMGAVTINNSGDNSELNNNISGLKSAVNLLSHNVQQFSRNTVTMTKDVISAASKDFNVDKQGFMMRSTAALAGPVGAIVNKALVDSGVADKIGEAVKNSVGRGISTVGSKIKSVFGRERYDSQSGYLSPVTMSKSISDANDGVIKELHSNVASPLYEANDIAKEELQETKTGNRNIVTSLNNIQKSLVTGENGTTGAGRSGKSNYVSAISGLQVALLAALDKIEDTIKEAANYRGDNGQATGSNEDVIAAITNLGSKFQSTPDGMFSTVKDFIVTGTKVGTLFSGKYVNDIKKGSTPFETIISANIQQYRWQRLYGELTKRQLNEIIKLMGGQEKDVVGQHGLLKETYLKNKGAITKRFKNNRLGKIANGALSMFMYDEEDMDNKNRTSMQYGLEKSLRENPEGSGILFEALSSLPGIHKLYKHTSGKDRKSMYDFANEIHNTDGVLDSVIGNNGQLSYIEQQRMLDAMSDRWNSRGQAINVANNLIERRKYQETLQQNVTASNRVFQPDEYYDEEEFANRGGSSVLTKQNDSTNKQQPASVITANIVAHSDLEPNPIYNKNLANVIDGSVPVTIVGITNTTLESLKSIQDKVPSIISSQQQPDEGSIDIDNITPTSIAASENNDDQNTTLLSAINNGIEQLTQTASNISEDTNSIHSVSEDDFQYRRDRDHDSDYEQRINSSRSKKKGKTLDEMLGGIWKLVKGVGIIIGGLHLLKGITDKDSVQGKILRNNPITWGYQLGKWIGDKTGLDPTGGYLTGAVGGYAGFKATKEGIKYAVKHPIKTAKSPVTLFKKSKDLVNKFRGKTPSVPTPPPAASATVSASNSKTVTTLASKAKNARKLLKGKKGKALAIGAAVAGAGYLGSKLFGSNDEDTSKLPDNLDYDIDGVVPGSMPVSIVGIADGLQLSGDYDDFERRPRRRRKSREFDDGDDSISNVIAHKESAGSRRGRSYDLDDQNTPYNIRKNNRFQNRREKAIWNDLHTVQKEYEESTQDDGKILTLDNAITAGVTAPMVYSGIKETINTAKGGLNNTKSFASPIKNTVTSIKDAAKNTVSGVKNAKNAITAAKGTANTAKAVGSTALKAGKLAGKGALKVAGKGLVALDVGMDVIEAAGRYKDANDIGDAFDNGAVGQTAIAATKAASVYFPPLYLAAMAGDYVLGHVDKMNEQNELAAKMLNESSEAFNATLNSAKSKSKSVSPLLSFADGLANYDTYVDQYGQLMAQKKVHDNEVSKEMSRFAWNRDTAKMASENAKSEELMAKAIAFSLLHGNFASSRRGSINTKLDTSTGRYIPVSNNSKKEYIETKLKALAKQGYTSQHINPQFADFIIKNHGDKNIITKILDVERPKNVSPKPLPKITPAVPKSEELQTPSESKNLESIPITSKVKVETKQTDSIVKKQTPDVVTVRNDNNTINNESSVKIPRSVNNTLASGVYDNNHILSNGIEATGSQKQKFLRTKFNEVTKESERIAKDKGGLLELGEYLRDEFRHPMFSSDRSLRSIVTAKAINAFRSKTKLSYNHVAYNHFKNGIVSGIANIQLANDNQSQEKKLPQTVQVINTNQQSDIKPSESKNLESTSKVYTKSDSDIIVSDDNHVAINTSQAKAEIKKTDQMNKEQEYLAYKAALKKVTDTLTQNNNQQVGQLQNIVRNSNVTNNNIRNYMGGGSGNSLDHFYPNIFGIFESTFQ